MFSFLGQVITFDDNLKNSTEHVEYFLMINIENNFWSNREIYISNFEFNF